MTRRNIYTLLPAAILLLSILSGCGGSGSVSPPPNQVSVKVSPGAVSLIAGATQQFTAAVTGTSSTAVSWSVSGCTGSACGAVDATGLYTAPSPIPSAITVNVVATLQSDTSKTDSAKVSQVPISVTLSETDVNIGAGDSHQFTVTVAGTTNTTVTWTFSGCPNSGCGTIGASGLYSSPSTVSSAADITVTATSQADNTKFASATIHLQLISVSISPAGPVNVMIAQTQGFTVITQYDVSNAGVIWSLPATCTAVTCGTLSNVDSTSVTYTAPATVPNPAAITLTATSVTDSNQKKEVTINVVATVLRAGDYAFIFSGWGGLKSIEARQVTVGHFHADGNGNITAGVQDTSDHFRVTLSESITGSYAVNPDHRGTLTINSANYDMTVDATGTKGNFLRLNGNMAGNATGGCGSFELQDSSAFSSSALAGSYALGLNAKPDDSQTMAAVGRFTVNSSGTLSNGEMDMLAPTATYTQMTLGGTAQAPSSTTGRGTATLTLNPAPGSFLGTMQFVYYVVSADKILLMQTDAQGSTVPMLNGAARRQTGTMSLAAFNAPVIFELAGMHSYYQSAVVGQITPNGSGSMTGIFDQNYESNAALDQSLSGTYTLDSKGRSTLTMLGGTAVAYFFGPNHAYLMQQPSTDILYGNLKPQTTSTYSPASLGTLRISEAEAISPFAECDAGIITFDGVGSATYAQDFSYFMGDGTYVEVMSQTGGANYTLDVNGRGVLTVGSFTLPFWLVSADEVTVINTATNGVDSLPVVEHYLK